VNIVIGGTLSKFQIPELYDIVDDAYLYSNNFEFKTLEQFLEGIRDGHGLDLVCDECGYGGLDDITNFCAGNNLPYDTNWSGGYEYESSVQWWRPGMPHEQEKSVLKDGEDYVRAPEIERILNDKKTPSAKIKAIKRLMPEVPSEFPGFHVTSSDTIGAHIIEAILDFEATIRKIQQTLDMEEVVLHIA
jgi:hypothetical protein